MKREEPVSPTFKFGINQFLWLFVITVVAFACYIGLGGWGALQDVYSGTANIRDTGIYSYFNNIFTIACYLMAIFVFRIKNKSNGFTCCLYAYVCFYY